MREIVQELIPLLALLLQGEDGDQHGEHLQMEDEVEEILRCPLLPSDLEVALL